MLKQKQLIIGAVFVILLLLLGIGGFFLFNKSAVAPTQNQTSDTSNAPAENKSAVASLADLLTSGKTTQCTFNVATSNGGSTNGTVYVSADKMRGDFTITTKDGKASQMNMIRAGDDYYMWGGELPGGIKMTFDAESIKTNTQANQYVDLNTKTDYRCSDWTADNSKFTPPSNVKFTDLSSMMGKESPTGTKTQTGSSPCDDITDTTAKAACENALKQYGQ